MPINKEKQSELEKKLIARAVVKEFSKRDSPKIRNTTSIKDSNGALYIGIRSELHGKFDFIPYNTIMERMREKSSKEPNYSPPKKAVKYITDKF